MSTIALRTLFPRKPFYLNPLSGAAFALLLPRIAVPIFQILGSSFTLAPLSLPFSIALVVVQALSGIYLVALVYFSSCGFPRHIRNLHQEDSIQDIMKPLETQLSQILNLEGEAKDLIKNLGAEFHEIKTAFDELKACKKDQDKLIQLQSDNNRSLTEDLEELSDEIDGAFWAYEYLNEGPGQFEEYESFPREDRANLKQFIKEAKEACASEEDETCKELCTLLDMCETSVEILTGDQASNAQKIQGAVQILDKVKKLSALSSKYKALSDCLEGLGAYVDFQSQVTSYLKELIQEAKQACASEEDETCDELCALLHTCETSVEILTGDQASSAQKTIAETVEKLRDLGSKYEAFSSCIEALGACIDYQTQRTGCLKELIQEAKQACASEEGETCEELCALLHTCEVNVALLTTDQASSAQKTIAETVEELRAFSFEYHVLSDCIQELRTYASYQQNACRFSQRLAQRKIAEALEEYDSKQSNLSYCTEKLQEKLAHFKDDIISGDFIVGDYSNEYIEQVLRSWFEPLKEVIHDIEGDMQSKLDGISRERVDDPHDPNGEAALEAMIDWSADCSETVDEAENALTSSFIALVGLQRQRLDLEAALVDHDERQNQAVIKLIGQLKSAKGEKRHAHVRELGSVADRQSLERQATFQRIIGLIRRDEINRKDPLSDKGELRAKRDHYLLRLKNPLKDTLEPIDLYIQWHRHSSKLEMLLQKPQEEAAEKFNKFGLAAKQPSLNERLQLLSRYCLDLCSSFFGSAKRDLFVLYEKEGGKKDIIRVRSSTDNPLDSALARLIRVLPKRQLRKAVFQYSGLGFSEFERGILKLAGRKNPDADFCTQDAYEKMATSNRISQLHLLEPKPSSVPDYLSTFDLPHIVCPKISVDQLNLLKGAYSLLAARLAFTFHGDSRRKQLGLPIGHPIACLIVDKYGRLISWGINTIGSGENEDFVRHAEVNALSSYFLRNPSIDQLPEGCTIFSSLKPCEMCAGAIYDTCKGIEYNVHYSRDDPGANAKATILDKSPKSPLVLSEMEVFQKINEAYLEQKKETPSLNAAEALDPNNCADIHKSFKLKLQQLPPGIADYLSKIYEHITGEILDFPEKADTFTLDDLAGSQS